MQVHIRICIYVSVLILLCGCNSPNVKDEKTFNIDLKNLPESPTTLENIITDMSIIPLETSEDCLVSYVSKICPVDNQLLVKTMADQRLLVFNQDGSFSHHIGQIGKGPGEYLYATEISYRAGLREIMVFDTRHKKVLLFDKSGALIKEFKTNAYGFKAASINDTLYGVHAGRMGFLGQMDQHFQLWIINQAGELIDSLFHYRDAQGLDFSWGFIPAQSGQFTYYSPMADYSIYKISGEGLDTLYQFDFGDANLDTAKYMSDEFFNDFIKLEDKIQSLMSISNTTQDISFQAYSQNPKKALILVNHKSRNHRVFRTDSMVMGTYHQMPVTIPQWADDTYRYAAISTIDWFEYLSNISDSDKANLRKIIPGFAQAEAIEPEDNPIILKFKFNEF